MQHTYLSRHLKKSTEIFLFSLLLSLFTFQTEAQCVVQTGLRPSVGSPISIPQCPLYRHKGSHLLKIFNKVRIICIIKLLDSPGVCVNDEITCIPTSYAHLTSCVSSHSDLLRGLAIKSYYCQGIQLLNCMSKLNSTYV